MKKASNARNDYRYGLCIAIRDRLVARLRGMNPELEFLTSQDEPRKYSDDYGWVQIHQVMTPGPDASRPPVRERDVHICLRPGPKARVSLTHTSPGKPARWVDFDLAPGLVRKMRPFLADVGIRV